jgi:hypothetical protein
MLRSSANVCDLFTLGMACAKTSGARRARSICPSSSLDEAIQKGELGKPSQPVDENREPTASSSMPLPTSTACKYRRKRW